MADIKYNVTGLQEVQEQIAYLAPSLVDAGVEEASKNILDKVVEYPARVNHDADNPYQWQSEKQRRAYFATNGFGHGIPYPRSNQLSSGWRLEGMGRNTSVVNDVPYASFVMGQDQQRGHSADGWATVEQIAAGSAESFAGGFTIANVVAWVEDGISALLRRLGF